MKYGPGGGIDIYKGTVTVSESTITGNTTGGHGGGIHNEKGTLTVSDSTISGNTAREGGGIYVPYDGRHPFDVPYGADVSLTVERSTISSNTASEGGGILSSTTSSGWWTHTTTITNSTISGNTATNHYGGGVYNNSGTTEVRHSTITDNSAPAGKGGGVASFGAASMSTRVFSSVVSDNAYTDNTGADTGTDVDFVANVTNSFVSEGHNLIGDGNATAAFDKPGDQIEVTDLGLEPLSLNGGPTKTHALKATSPALDAGPPHSGCPTVDQRGFDRAQQGGGTCDVGSFEADVTAPSVASATPDAGKAGVRRNANVMVLFSEAMDPRTLVSNPTDPANPNEGTSTTFTLARAGANGSVPAKVSVSADGKTATLDPSAKLGKGKRYTVRISGAKDPAGNALPEKTWSFKTGRR